MLLSFLEADIENARFSRAGQGCVFDEVFGYGQERPGKFRSVDLFPAANLDVSRVERDLHHAPLRAISTILPRVSGYREVCGPDSLPAIPAFNSGTSGQVRLYQQSRRHL
jgi:hypothetical protein